jgi:hypothetical protein
VQPASAMVGICFQKTNPPLDLLEGVSIRC